MRQRPSTAHADCAPIPRSAFGPAVNEQGYFVGRVEGNLYWVTDGTYQSAFLTTADGVVLFDAPPTIGHNIQRAVDEIAAANGVSNEVTHLIYSHHHADHTGASALFGRHVTRIGHEETRRLLLRDDDPARPAPEETFQDRRRLEIGAERIELAWHGANHSPDNIFIHLPDHDALMLVDIVSPGWAPVCQSNLIEDIPGYIAAPATALTYPWEHFIGGHMGRLGTATTSRRTGNTSPISRTVHARRWTPSIPLPISPNTARTPGSRRGAISTRRRPPPRRRSSRGTPASWRPPTSSLPASHSTSCNRCASTWATGRRSIHDLGAVAQLEALGLELRELRKSRGPMGTTAQVRAREITGIR